jgi:hypothetical protein
MFNKSSQKMSLLSLLLPPMIMMVVAMMTTIMMTVIIKIQTTIKKHMSLIKINSLCHNKIKV